MTSQPSRTGLQLRSIVKAGGELELSLVSVTTPAPGPDDVIVRIHASPLNPSDIGLLFGAADLSTAKAAGIPVIAGRSGGVPDAVADGQSGLLVDGASLYAVTQSLRELLGDRARRESLGAQGRLWARNFSWESVAARVRALSAAPTPSDAL